MTSWQAVRAARATHEAQTARQQAEANEQKAVAARSSETKLREQAQMKELAARQRAYASDMNIANQALAGNNLGWALELVNRQLPKPGQRDLRGWEWRYLWQQTRSHALFTLCHESDEINSLAVSVDGRWLAVGGYHQAGLSVWDLRTHRKVIHLAENQTSIMAAFSPSEPILAFTDQALWSAGKSQPALHLWNMATRQMLRDIPLDDTCVGLAFSEDGQTLVTSTSEGHVTLWRVHDGTLLAGYATDQGWVSPATTPFAVTSDLKLAAYGLRWKRICAVDLRDGKELWTAVASKAYITALAFSPDRTILASAAGFGESDIRLWEVASGKEIGQLKGHGSFVSSLVFWPDGKKLASGSGDQTIRIWDVATHQCLDVLRGHLLEVFRLALLPDGKTLLSGSKDGAVCFWDTSVPHANRTDYTLEDNVVAWCFTPDGQSALTLDQQGNVLQWSGEDFQRKAQLLAVPTNCSRASFSRDVRFLAVSWHNGLVQVWDTPQRELLGQITNNFDIVRLSPPLDNGHRVICADISPETLNLKMWNLETGQQTTYSCPRSISAIKLSISPDARRAIVSGWEGGSRCIDLSNGEQRNLGLDLLESAGTDFSPDGGFFAASSHLGYARVWDTATWTEQATLRGYLVGLSSLVFSPDGKRLVTGGDGKEALRSWDVESWQPVLTLEAQGVNYHDTAFSLDGNSIGSVNASGALHIWRAPSWDEINAAVAKDPPSPIYGGTGKMEAKEP